MTSVVRYEKNLRDEQIKANVCAMFAIIVNKIII